MLGHVATTFREAYPAEDRLGSAIKRAEQVLITRKTAALRELDLTVPQYSAMYQLALHRDGMSAAQLARGAYVSPQTMTGIVAKLEEKGLIARLPAPVHARVLVAKLTDAGLALLRDADRRAVAVERDLAAEFTDDEHQQLIGLLCRAIGRLSGSDGVDPDPYPV
jgi:DNA-binding MarR family transcriptional regulator